MSTLPALGSALYVKLAQDADLCALIGGTTDPRIYNHLAPAETTRPYVVYALTTGRILNVCPRDTLDWVLRVEAIASSRAEREQTFEAVYTALHESAVVVSGWSNYALTCENVTDLTELESGRQYWRRIGDFRLRVSED